MVVAIGRILLTLVVLQGLAACAAADAPVRSAARDATPAPSPVASVAAVPPTPPAVRVETVNGASSVQAGPGAYRYSVQIPQLVGLAPHGQALDAPIRGTLQRDIDAFVSAAQEAQSPTDLTCSSQAERVTARLAVLRVDCTASQTGVPRATTFTHTFNCDLAGTRILALQDLFRAGSAYLDVLSTAARSQFPAQATPAADRTVAEGTAPVAGNFKAFLLTQAALVIVFPDYEVAAGTATAPQVSISYDDLRRYLAPGIADLLAS